MCTMRSVLRSQKIQPEKKIETNACSEKDEDDWGKPPWRQKNKRELSRAKTVSETKRTQEE